MSLKPLFKRGLIRALSAPEVRRTILDQIPDRRDTALRSLSNLPGPFVTGKEFNGTRFRDDVVFLTSRFRSGSTALWNAFRQLDNVTAYYEPFNERRFFDQQSRGTGVDPTHIGVTDYAREYNSIEGLEALYDENWTRHSLYMDEKAWNPDMLRFIEILIESAAGRPVLQFNRIDFRLPWLRANFPNASIVHLWRNPREQWCSVLGDLERFPCTTPAAEFPGRFYQSTWIEDLQHIMPFLRDNGSMHPYRLFYLLWKVSWLFGRHYATSSLSYESLVNSPDDTLANLADELQLDDDSAKRMGNALVQTGAERWTDYAHDDWYIAHESYCESLLDRFFDLTGAAATEASSRDQVDASATTVSQ